MVCMNLRTKPLSGNAADGLSHTTWLAASQQSLPFQGSKTEGGIQRAWPPGPRTRFCPGNPNSALIWVPLSAKLPTQKLRPMCPCTTNSNIKVGQSTLGLQQVYSKQHARSYTLLSLRFSVPNIALDPRRYEQ